MLGRKNRGQVNILPPQMTTFECVCCLVKWTPQTYIKKLPFLPKNQQTNPSQPKQITTKKGQGGGGCGDEIRGWVGGVSIYVFCYNIKQSQKEAARNLHAHAKVALVVSVSVFCYFEHHHMG